MTLTVFETDNCDTTLPLKFGMFRTELMTNILANLSKNSPSAYGPLIFYVLSCKHGEFLVPGESHWKGGSACRKFGYKEVQEILFCGRRLNCFSPLIATNSLKTIHHPLSYIFSPQYPRRYRKSSLSGPFEADHLKRHQNHVFNS